MNTEKTITRLFNWVFLPAIIIAVLYYGIHLIVALLKGITLTVR